MATTPSPSDDGRLPLHSVRVYSIPIGPESHITFLGPLKFLPTHHAGGRTIPCRGRSGLCPAHKGELIYKGYGPAEVWDEVRRLWCPICIEVTENMAELLEGHALRGQVWMFRRRGGPKGKRSAVDGWYAETLQEHAVSPAFAIEDVLKRFYRVEELLWCGRPDLPDRVALPLVDRAPPTLIERHKEPPAPPTQEQLDTMRRLAGRNRTRTVERGNNVTLNGRPVTPPAESNGHAGGTEKAP